ncbi:MAG: hypothetical protein JXB88_21550 [Spirochaetales bacterium]|nr:hypothetical protein [Spirochaetales bacterium]
MAPGKEEKRNELMDSIIPLRFSVLFIYPFEYELIQGRFTPDLFDNFSVSKNYYWKHHEYDYLASSLNYNEYFYFYTYIREIIFDKREKKVHNVLFFRLMHPENNENLDLNYTIECDNNKCFELPVIKINLHLFDSGIGFLILQIEDSSNKHNIRYYLNFINLGRRLYPPYLGMGDKIEIYNDIKRISCESNSKNAFNNLDCPEKIIIKNRVEELVSHDFKQVRDIEENEIIAGLIGKARYGFTKKHILDDRMISLCYYEFPENHKGKIKIFLNSLSEYFSYKNNSESKNQSASLKLYFQMLFIDAGSPSCSNFTEMKNIIDKSTYKRWATTSFYGFSRFSCVFITINNYIYNHFSCMYYQMALLIFLYRSMLLKFSKKSSKIGHMLREEKNNKKIINELEELKKGFILFRNKFWFREITPQDQGIEMFNLWESVIQVNTLLNDVKQEIDEIYSYINLQNEKEINNRLRSISIIGFVLLPFSIVVGIWGIDKFDYTKLFFSYFTEYGILSPGWIFLLMAVCFIFISWGGLKLMSKYINRQKSKRFIFFLGGHDAEMCEIKKLLKKQKQKVVDNNLQWGATLSYYSNKIEKIKEYEIPVFIELEKDIPIPEKSIIIDHHGRMNLKSSIEQVADLLDIRLDRQQTLISINDVSYITGLRKAGASEEEIEKIRRYDRQCQGVTKKDEQMAVKAIAGKKEYGKLVLITSEIAKTSPVTDRLFEKYENILIIAKNEVNFFGRGKIVAKLKQDYPASWYGGNLPEYGFWGMKTAEEDIKEKIVKEIKGWCGV